MEVIGQSSCQPIGECGTGTFGTIPTSGTTMFVDQSYLGAGSNGSKAKPFLTVGAALKAVAAGGSIAVAPGEYREDLILNKPVVVEGRCPQMVTIRGQSSTFRAVAVGITVSGVELRSLTVTGPQNGVVLQGAKATLEHLAVVGCGEIGVVAHSGAAADIRYSVIAGNNVAGLRVLGAEATLDHTVVKDNQNTTADLGAGIQVRQQAGFGPASLVLRDCVVSRKREYGLLIFGSKATLERSVLSDTLPRATGIPGDKNNLKKGIAIQSQGEQGASTLAIRDCLLTRNRGAGLSLYDTAAFIDRAVVRDTLPEEAGQLGGGGIFLSISEGGTGLSSLELRDSLIDHNRNHGIMVADAPAIVERTVVSGTLPAASGGHGGWGVVSARLVDPGPPVCSLRDSVVAGNSEVGVYAGGDLSLERTVVSNTQAIGIGILLSGGPELPRLSMSGCVVDRNKTTGIFVSSARASIQRTRIGRTQSSDFGDAIAVSSGELDLSDSMVETSSRAGVLSLSSSGSIRRCEIRQNKFCIDLEGSPAPEVTEDNLFEENQENQVTFGRGLLPTPLPPPPTL
jgi:hypothetical protein